MKKRANPVHFFRFIILNFKALCSFKNLTGLEDLLGFYLRHS